MAVTPINNKSNFNFKYADAALCPAKIILAHFLQEISTATHVKPLMHMDLETLEKAYDVDTLKNLTDQEVLFRLSLLREYPFPYSRVGVELICEHFNDKYPGVFDHYFDYQGEVINARGAKLILDEITAKKESTLPIRVMNEENLADFLASSEPCSGFILGLTGLTHYISLFLQKREDGKVDLISTDSCGVWFIDNILGDLPKDLPLGDVYTSEVQRQADGVHCSVFAIRDLAVWMDLYAKGVNPVEMLKENSPDLHPDTLWGCKVNVFSYLPPAMMKVTQSMTKIEAYEQTHGVSIHTHAFHHPEQEEGSMNCLIEHRYIKYSIALIENALNERQILV